MWWWLGGIGLVAALVVAYSLLVMASRCSREEEAMYRSFLERPERVLKENVAVLDKEVED